MVSWCRKPDRFPALCHGCVNGIDGGAFRVAKHFVSTLLFKAGLSSNQSGDERFRQEWCLRQHRLCMARHPWFRHLKTRGLCCQRQRTAPQTQLRGIDSILHAWEPGRGTTRITTGCGTNGWSPRGRLSEKFADRISALCEPS